MSTIKLQAMATNSFRYIRFIDGLRAVAVAGVFINHLNDDLLKSGFFRCRYIFCDLRVCNYGITGKNEPF